MKLKQHMKGSPRRQTIQSEILEGFFFLRERKEKMANHAFQTHAENGLAKT